MTAPGAARTGPVAGPDVGTPPSGQVTFLFTDIEGSTRLWEAAPEAMGQALETHDRLLRAGIEAHRGYVFSTGGDGLAAAFADPVEAARAGVEVQGALAAQRWPPEAPIRVRMGLHTGQALERDGDYFGPTVNQAARLMDVAHGGQIVCSAATARLLTGSFTVVDLGEHRLRDLSAPQRVYQLGEGAFSPLRTLDVYPGNLAPSPSSFVGRRQELGEVIAAVRQHRLVTITGVGGVGKTRVALQAAAQLLPGFRHGAWFCELAAATNEDELTEVVAQTLGVAPRPQMTMAESIVDFLRGRQLLLILDNCEHLLDAAAELAEAVLIGAPEVRILATSREGLGVPGEQVWPLRSMPVRSEGGLAPGDAAQLFADRAAAVSPGFSLEEAPEAVTEIARRLDGIPLAIELAAARVASMSPAEIAAHLDERFRLLTGGRRRRVERHHTLQAALDWSYSLLDPTEKAVFDCLGVFPSSFDEAAAVAVCASGSVDRWAVIDALSGLVAKSMLGVERSGEATRYQLLETVRHFARDRLEASGGIEAARRRHAEHFCDFAVEAATELLGQSEIAWRCRLRVEVANLRAAVGWAVDADDPDEQRLGTRILDNLAREATNSPSLSVQSWARNALRSTENLGDAERLGILAGAAFDAQIRGDLPTALALGRRAAAAAEGFPPPLLTAYLTMVLATMSSGRGEEALAVLDEGLARLNAAGDPRQRASLVVVGAWVAYVTGDADTALAEASEAVRLARQVGSPSMLASALATWARVSAEQGGPALAAAEESIRLTRSGAGDSAYGPALQTAALLQVEGHDLPAAAASMRAAIDHEARLGNRLTTATNVRVAIVVLAAAGQEEEAIATLAGAVTGPVLGGLGPFLGGEHRDSYVDDVRQVSRQLGRERFGQHRQRGQAMAYEEIINFTDAALDRVLVRLGAETA